MQNSKGKRKVRLKPDTTSSAAQPAYWAVDPAELFRRFACAPEGLSDAEAARRLRKYGPNELRERRPPSRFDVLLRQVRSPLLLLLVFAAAASMVTGEWIDAAIVVTIVAASVGIGYSREYRAQIAAAELRTRLDVRTGVLRDGQACSVRSAEIVPGDVVLLSAGSLVPADAVLLEATDFFVNEAVLTGESYPVQKMPGAVEPAAALAERTNCVFLGTNVQSGTARCLVCATGPATEFGAVAHRLTLRPPETEFDRGIRRFGYLLTSAMLVMVLLVFVAHVFHGRPPVDTLLFSMALAVGLSPELLPAILSVNLARGAQMMADRGVLVRRLNAIENLGQHGRPVHGQDRDAHRGRRAGRRCLRRVGPAVVRTCSTSRPATRRSRPAWPARSTTPFCGRGGRTCRMCASWPKSRSTSSASASA